ncbi:hypothetical protein [Geothrix sp. PMB-07]|uniref:hypothetical protein n=1 Tax=Geothrix sp. PMB-07 TaxID=3068640 RepID=UPI0027429642|nr:hypothetical protein [Geothrix sp. PMB-07]WLT32901.1 hypothetical protein Q9293_06100 [Geothrix sp. PMB-07]
MTMLLILIIIGVGLYLVLRGKQDQPEQLGASRRALPTGPLEPHTFPCPYPKCPTCGASGDKMKQDWDGLRSVKWTCGYCGALAGVQALKDEELPPSARRLLGVDGGPMQGSMPMQQGGYGQSGGGMGGLLTGMMIGSMMGGGGHHHHDHSDSDGWGGGSSDSSSSDWGESNSSGWGDSGGGDSGGDWGGGDSGGGDSGGGDW